VEAWRAEAVGLRRISTRLDRIEAELAALRDKLAANDRERARIVGRINWLVREHDRLARKEARLLG
jgi:hypothetical protein